MDERELNHVLEAIDGALGDWSVSGDAMRWSPEQAEGDPPSLDLSVEPGWAAGRLPAAPSWVGGLRIVEDPAVAPGEAAISVEVEHAEIGMGGVIVRRVVTASQTEARISSRMSEAERDELVGRIAHAYGVRVCDVGAHRWSTPEYVEVTLHREGEVLGDIAQQCERCGQHRTRLRVDARGFWGEVHGS